MDSFRGTDGQASGRILAKPALWLQRVQGSATRARPRTKAVLYQEASWLIAHQIIHIIPYVE